jgi:phospholipase C
MVRHRQEDAMTRQQRHTHFAPEPGSSGVTASPATRLTRRTFLKWSGLAGVGALGGAYWSTGPTVRRVRAASPAETPLEHVIISMQENRSFDHYFGYAPWIETYGPPDGYSQPDGLGGSVAPYHFDSLATPDIPHSWGAVHEQWNGGAMDGFYTNAGINALGYYTEADLPFYYDLHEESALAVNFFCSQLGPTWPNRFYLMAGTSGGITTNGLWGYGIFDYPMILDLLDAAGVSWKVYNLGWDSVPYGNTDNVAVFWKHFAHDTRTRGSMGAFLNDARKDRLPQVSFVIPSYARGWDEHPPADVSIGMGLQEELVTGLRASPAWDSSAYIITYDEHGGYFDHVVPPRVDAFGLGVRVPTWIISPWAKPGYLDPTVYDHTSILKFLERLHGLPTLASVNHLFDAGTPGGGNYDAAGGAAVGPPAPPRDDRGDLGDLFNAFTF